MKKIKTVLKIVGIIIAIVIIKKYVIQDGIRMEYT